MNELLVTMSTLDTVPGGPNLLFLLAHFSIIFLSRNQQIIAVLHLTCVLSGMFDSLDFLHDSNRSFILAISVVVGLVLVVVFKSSSKTGKAIPINKESMLTTAFIMGSKDAPFFTFNCMKTFGRVFRLNMPFLHPFIVCTDPTLIRKIYEEQPEKPDVYFNFSGATNHVHSMFTKKTVGMGWEWARKGVAKSFSFSNLSVALPLIYPVLEEAISIVDEHARNKTSFDIDLIGTHLTMDFIGVSMFGVEFRTMHEGSQGRRLQHLINVVLRECALKQVYNPLRRYMFWHPEVVEASGCCRDIVAVGEKILNDYRAAHSAAELASDQTIMGSLIRSPYPSDKERVADMTTFLVAGHDTTGYTMSWTIIEVAQRPEVYARLKAEIDATVPAGADRITPSQASALVYLDMVVKEAMRLWPVAAQGTMRLLNSDVEYEGMVIPRGATVAIPFFTAFRVGIQDPELFDPDRWAETAPEIDKLKELFLPFASGKRNCVGQNLAMLELKLALATLFRSFSFRLEKQEVEKDYFLTLKPANVKIFAERVK